jgi:hypothetical protein
MHDVSTQQLHSLHGEIAKHETPTADEDAFAHLKAYYLFHVGDVTWLLREKSPR